MFYLKQTKLKPDTENINKVFFFQTNKSDYNYDKLFFFCFVFWINILDLVYSERFSVYSISQSYVSHYFLF